MQQTIAVLGEALIDLVEDGDDEARLARPGGSPYNVALGLARLGHPAAFVGRLSRDPLGTILRNHALRSGVDLSLSVDAPEPSTVALLELSAGVAQYRFGADGTADFRWTDAELALLTADVAALHFGSLASWLPPGDTAVLRRVETLRADVLISYDPNVRPHLQPDAAAARRQVERAVALAHLVRTSEEDLAHLYPGGDAGDVARGWLGLGPALVVVTRGGDGARAHTTSLDVARGVPVIDVVDTVGAGDAFTSGLLATLAQRELLDAAALTALDTQTLGAVLDDAALVAALTCSRAGATPPRRADLDAFTASG
ncbi:MAG: carbohydrate kinase family protein [Jatrophihabitans sp.]